MNKTMAKKGVAAIILFYSLAFAVRADFDVARWQFKKEIVAPGGTVGKVFAELFFDNEIFSNSKSDLNDVRIIDQGGGEVPYILATEAPSAGKNYYSARILDKGIVPGEYSVFTADIGGGGIIHNQVEILTDNLDPNSKNFRRQVSVEGSADQVNWLLLGQKSIYDYTYEFKARDTSVGYTDSTSRYLRVKIFDNGVKPLAIIGARVYREVNTPGREASYVPVGITQSEDKVKQASFILMDFGVRGLPTQKITLSTDDVNFNRGVAIEGSNDEKDWAIVLYRDVVFSYETPAFTGSKLTISYPESNYRFLRLTIFNKDDKPINVSGVSASGFLRKLVFAYDPSFKYAVYYGNSKVHFPEYDLKNYIEYFQSSGRIKLSLGNQIANSSYEPLKLPQKPWSERHPDLLLWTLVFAVFVVGLLVFRLFKKAKQ